MSGRRSTLSALFRFLAGAAAVTAIAIGSFFLWFTVGWSDAFGTTPEYAPGLAFLSIGVVTVTYLIATRLRPKATNAAATRRLALQHEQTETTLAPCPGCGKSIDARRPQCPYCGAGTSPAE